MPARSLLPILFVLVALCVPALAADRPAPPPNIIFILADDLGSGDLGSYGSPLRLTPAIDRLAAEGARFTQFYAPTPYCAPSRASLLTGRYPSRHGLLGNPTPDGTPAVDQLALAADEILLPQLLRPRGYATGMIGKWHLGHKTVDSWPTRRGFDSYFGILYSNDMRPVQLIKQESVAEYPVVQATLTQRYTQRALEFITAHRERPFFLYLAHAMPHKPLAVSEKFAGKSGAGLYGDVLAELDWSIEQIMAKLRALGLDDQTLVVFSSDNGAYFGGSNGGLRGMKAMTSEGGLRVPCIARWPGRIPAGQTLATPAVLNDWFPTLLASAGGTLPGDRAIDGRTLWPVLAEKSTQLHEAIFGFQGTTLRTVRNDRWKLHVEASQPRAALKPGAPWVDPRAPDGVTILAPAGQAHPSQYPGLDTGDPLRAGALFDLQADPGEQHDVAAAHPEIVARLRTLSAEFIKAAAESRRPKNP